MIYQPFTIANTVLQKARYCGQYMDSIKLQRMIYMLDGWHCAIYGNSCLGELFEAQLTGPTIRSIHQFVTTNWTNLNTTNWTNLNLDYLYDLDFAGYPRPYQTVPSIDGQFYSLLDAVWKKYSEMAPTQLDTFVYSENSPLHHARCQNEVYISTALIKEFFTKLALMGREQAQKLSYESLGV